MATCTGAGNGFLGRGVPTAKKDAHRPGIAQRKACAPGEMSNHPPQAKRKEFMNRFRSTTCLALTALSLLLLACTVKANEQVPFEGILQGDVVHTPISPTVDSVAVDAVGHAAHLGQFTLTMPHLVDRAAR